MKGVGEGFVVRQNVESAALQSPAVMANGEVDCQQLVIESRVLLLGSIEFYGEKPERP